MGSNLQEPEQIKLTFFSKTNIHKSIKTHDLNHVKSVEKVEELPLAYQPGTKTSYFRDYLLVLSEIAANINGFNIPDLSLLPAVPRQYNSEKLHELGANPLCMII